MLHTKFSDEEKELINRAITLIVNAKDNNVSNSMHDYSEDYYSKFFIYSSKPLPVGYKNYAGNMNVAMELADYIRKDYAITMGDVVFTKRWAVRIFNEPDLPYYKVDVEDEDPAVAICLAFLQLKNVDINKALNRKV